MINLRWSLASLGSNFAVFGAACAIGVLACSPAGAQPSRVADAAGVLGLPAADAERLAGQWNELSVYARNRIRCAGTRTACRSLSESLRVFRDSIDPAIRRGGPSSVDRFLRGKDWSHIVPVSAGGGNGASNGLWERSALNRLRGARELTPGEIAAAGRVVRTEAFRSRARSLARITGARLGKGALAGAVAAGVFTLTEAGVSYYQGHIDRAELQDRIRAAVVRDVAAGTAIGAIIGVLAPGFPFLAPVAGTILMMVTNELYARYGDSAIRRAADELSNALGFGATVQAAESPDEPVGPPVPEGTWIPGDAVRTTVVEFRMISNPGGLVPDLAPDQETWKGAALR